MNLTILCNIAKILYALYYIYWYGFVRIKIYTKLEMLQSSWDSLTLFNSYYKENSFDFWHLRPASIPFSALALNVYICIMYIWKHPSHCLGTSGLSKIDGHITGCMMVSNESLEEDCHKTWLQLIFGLNRGSYDAWRWKHSIEVAHEQLQVKGGTFSNDERWGIVGGWCKILVQVKGGGLSVAVASERRDVF